MTVTSGFFNSVNKDRLYSAREFNEIFNGIITEGVLSTIGGSLLVTATTGTNMDILVASGKAWFNETWINNDSPWNYTLDNSFATLSRIDIVAMDYDSRDGVRNNTIIVLKGDYAETPVKPTLINVEDHRQVAIAEVLIGPGVTAVTNGVITNLVGTDDCPFATSLLDHVSIEELLIQWYSQYNEWLDGVKALLGGEDVTDLAEEILDIRSSYRRKNLLINGGMDIADRDPGNVQRTDWDDYYEIDRWFLSLTRGSSYFIRRVRQLDESWDLPGIPENPWWCEVTTDLALTLHADCHGYIEQLIEVHHLYDSRFGTNEARDLTLSFYVVSNTPGVYVAELISSNHGRHMSRTYSVAGTGSPEKIDIRYTGDVLFPVTDRLTVRMWFQAGSDYTSGQGNAGWSAETDSKRAIGQTWLGGNANNYWAVTHIQLELGSTATPFEMLHEDENRILCARYYEKSTVMNTRTYSMWGLAGTAWTIVRFKARKYRDPDITVDHVKIVRDNEYTLSNYVLADPFTNFMAQDPKEQFAVKGDHVSMLVGESYISRCGFEADSEIRN